MDRNSLHIIILTILVTITVTVFSTLGEYKLDLYISMYTLVYFTIIAILRPRRRTWDFLAAILFLYFSYIVVLKIMEILFP